MMSGLAKMGPAALAVLLSLSAVITMEDFNLCDIQFDSEQGFLDKESGIRYFWNLCSKNRPPSKCSDPSSAICAFKVNNKTGELAPLILNGGKLSPLSVKRVSSHHLSVTLSEGELCTLEGKNESYTTTFDMFCDSNSLFEGLDDNLRRVEIEKDCTLKFFWFTSAACAMEHTSRSFSDACIITLPDFEQRLQLSALSEDNYFQVKGTKADGHNTTFHLNICKPVRSGACTDGWPFCTVEKDGMPTSRYDGQNFTVTSMFDRSTHDVILTYETLETGKIGGFKAEFRITCDENARSIDINLSDSQNEGTKAMYNFVVKTSQVCLYRPDDCRVKTENATFNLFALVSKKDYVYHTQDPQNPGQKFFVSVCKPLSPASLLSKCLDPKTTICMYDRPTSSFKTIATHNLHGLTRHKHDDSLYLNFNNGEICKGARLYSSKIIFTCSDVEGGPTLFEVIDDCDYLFTWSSPSACKTSAKLISSNTCKIYDPHGDQVYDLGPLHNPRKDYTIMTDTGDKFDINICGANQLSCGTNGSEVSVCRDSLVSNKTVFGFTSSMTLNLYDAHLTMDFIGGTYNSSKTFSASISFLCDRKADVGQPEIVDEATDYVEMMWWTSYACMSSEELPCVAAGKDSSLYDLRELSLRHDNYELSFGKDTELENTRVILNVCKNIVPKPSHDCPPDSAACIATSIVKNGNRTELFESIGGLRQDFHFDDHGRLILEYTVGSLCTDPKSMEHFLNTKIIFSCRENVFQSEPRFIEFIDCTYIFYWETAAACKAKIASGHERHPGCKINSTSSGHMFDLSKLKLKNNLEIFDKSGNRIFLNVCAPLVNKDSKLENCGPNSGSCIMEPSGRVFNLGDADDSLEWSSTGELTLRYKAKSGNQTLIRFRCGQTRDGAVAAFIERSSSITIFDVLTSLACDHTVYCQAKSPSQIISLFALMNYEENFRVEVQNETYLLSVCKPLQQLGDINCSPESAICKLGKGKSGTNLGKPISSPLINSVGDVEIHYKNGSQCTEDSKKNYESRITFRCSKDVFPGKIEYDVKNLDKCRKNFIWKTNVVCPSTVTLPDDECKVFNPATGLLISLGDIQNTSDHADHIVDSNGRQYYIQSCSKFARMCNSSICMRDSINPGGIISFGSVSSSRFEMTTRTLVLEYKTNKACKENTLFTAEIRYSCPLNPKDAFPSPKLVTSFLCHLTFTWETTLMCANSKPKSEPNHLSSHSANATLTGGLLFFFALIVIGFFLACKKRRVRDRAIQSVMDYSERTASFFGKWVRRRPGGSSNIGNQVQIFGNINHDDDEELIIA